LSHCDGTGFLEIANRKGRKKAINQSIIQSSNQAISRVFVPVRFVNSGSVRFRRIAGHRFASIDSMDRWCRLFRGVLRGTRGSILQLRRAESRGSRNCTTRLRSVTGTNKKNNAPNTSSFRPVRTIERQRDRQHSPLLMDRT